MNVSRVITETTRTRNSPIYPGISPPLGGDVLPPNVLVMVPPMLHVAVTCITDPSLVTTVYS
ncbi:MAG: hypothetical protein KGD63_11515 [Candidatus Lokiarchaeota archaeon]|nr:hypothetical protein [Candidatus Lokiarchaeota archaeon]